jgi:SSS family solute:Na+ symporter
MMVKNILPVGVKGFVTIGFICALVTSLAAFFNSCATLFTEDFYKPMKKGKSEAHYVSCRTYLQLLLSLFSVCSGFL